MPPTRVFLDYSRPPLLTAVEFLRQKYAPSAKEPATSTQAAAKSPQKQLGFDTTETENLAPTPTMWDLSRVIVVVPGRRAGRRLLELLAFEARDHGLSFTPPDITTEGGLPERLYHPKKPFAEPLAQDLAWSQALRQLGEAQLRAIVPHAPPRDDDTTWLQLGRMLRVRHTELAADALTFQDVVKLGATLPKFPDTRRWEAMRQAQEIYLRTLDDLSLWDIQTARLRAIELGEIATDCDIVLLGTVDLNRTMRKILDEVADHVTALIAAPQSLADRFDAYGCLLPEQWQQVEIPLRDEQVRRVDGPADQADAVAGILAGYQGKYRGDQITIGVPDERLVPHLQRQLEQSEVPVRWVIGKLLSETGPYRLLAAVAELLRTQSLRSFAALLRHPDVFQRLTWGRRPRLPYDEAHSAAAGEDACPTYVLNELDCLQAEYLVTRLHPKSWPAEVRRKLEEEQRFASVVRALEQVGTLLAPLQNKPQPLSRWSQPILSVLHTLYADRCDANSLEALEKIGKCLQVHALLPERLDPVLSAADAIAWTLSQLQGEAIPPPASEEAVELLGWLELPLDDAPALIVTTFNEGYVPESSTADAFLPNSLRKSLGLIDNDRRYARDAYAVSAILASRETVHWISARRDAEENPLVPSRLLFATPPERVVERALRFFEAPSESPPRAPLVGAGVPAPKQSRLYVPRPDKIAESLMRLRVTQFRDYLACPYRFYLKHILRLEGVVDTFEELAANAFGNLIHKVLERFGADKTIRDSHKEEEIFEFLSGELRQCVGLRYGDHDRLAAVEIQIEQIKARLERFACWQAEQRRAGWRIVHSETTEESVGRSHAPSEEDGARLRPTSSHDIEAEIIIDELPLTLVGRIDRIDEHEGAGTIRIFDYKTGDGAVGPELAHRRRTQDGKEWIDLQLPLYRHLAEACGFAGPVQLGYIVITKSLDDIKHEVADWTDDDLASADEAMRDVVRKIRRGEFWRPAEPPRYADDFTALCQDRRLGGRLYEEEP